MTVLTSANNWDNFEFSKIADNTSMREGPIEDDINLQESRSETEKLMREEYYYKYLTDIIEKTSDFLKAFTQIDHIADKADNFDDLVIELGNNEIWLNASYEDNQYVVWSNRFSAYGVGDDKELAANDFLDMLEETYRSLEEDKDILSDFLMDEYLELKRLYEN